MYIWNMDLLEQIAKYCLDVECNMVKFTNFNISNLYPKGRFFTILAWKGRLFLMKYFVLANYTYTIQLVLSESQTDPK